MVFSKIHPKNTTHSLCLITVILLVGFCRYLPLEYPSLFNFSPAIGIFLFCGAYFRGSLSWLAPVLAIFLSDLLLNSSYGKSFLEPFMLVTLTSYFTVWFLGKKIGKQSNFKVWVSGAVTSALLFHFITCTFAWMVNPAYLKTFAGLIEAIIFGEPGFAPSYLFLRNSILGTIFFAICLRWAHLAFTNLSWKDEKVVHTQAQT